MSLLPPATFSEHWHRVAELQLELRPTVRISRQSFRGERWFVLRDPYNEEFFRISPAAHGFVGRLERGRTIQQVWEGCLEANPEEAPGQEEVIQLLGQLYRSNLLHGALPPDTGALFERRRQRRRREFRSALANLMFARFPLFDPDRFLLRFLPLVRPLLTPWGACVWALTLLWAVKLALEHARALASQAEGVLAPENLFLLYASAVAVKTLHELGHAFACRQYGGAVHRLGVMLMIFTPLPYVDATSSWGFASRWQRIFVASAGMMTELFAAALGLFVWAATSPGLTHSLAYNVLFTASVTTLVFNANPLLRYDGYYILSDLLEIPNLSGRAQQMLQFIVESRAFGVRGAASPARSGGEAAALAAYGLASAAYRLVIYASIIWFVSGKYLLLGLLLATAFVFQSFVLPAAYFARYLLRAPALERSRGRAWAVTAAALAAAVVLFGLIPFPQRFTAPGVLEAEQFSDLFLQAAGRLEKIAVPSGTPVAAGQTLLQLGNPELDQALAGAEAERREALAERERAMDRTSAELEPIARRIESIDQEISRIQAQITGLRIAAPHEGLWVAPGLPDAPGRWYHRGELAGRVIDNRRFRFAAAVAQEDAAALFNRELRGAEIRLAGQAGAAIPAQELQIIPGEQELLPSRALGWLGGGTIPTQAGDPSGRRAARPFYEARASLESAPGAVLYHGLTGKIRFRLPAMPLAAQVLRRLTQLMQDRPSL